MYDWNEWGGKKTCVASFEDITAPFSAVTEINISDEAATIEAVKIHNQKSIYLPRGLTHFFPGMKELYVFSSQLSLLDRCDFKGYTELTTISLSSNKLADIPYTTFDDLVNLKYFSLSYNQLTQIPSLRNMKLLKELYLFNNNLKSFTANDFIQNTNLEVVELYNNKLVNIDETIFKYLPALITADFSNNPCVDAKFPGMAKSQLEEILQKKCSQIIEEKVCT